MPADVFPTEVFSIQTTDRLQLQGKHWRTTKPKAVLCFIHGLGDHVGRHTHVGDFMAKHQISMVVYDQRGHGRSEGRRGHVPSYEALLTDVEHVLTHAKQIYPDIPVFLYGHSMGGNIVANYVLKKDTSMLAGAVISSPWLRLSFNPSAIRLTLAKVVSKVYPAYSQPNGLNARQLTHDPEIAKAYIADTLVHTKISATLFFGMYQNGEWAIKHAGQLKLPTLLMHGGDDPITSMPATKEFAHKAGDAATLKIWDGLLHEIHNESNRTEVLAYMKDWILAKMMK
jgi:alpha-beta hydrolase superfamily lysophospholipase